MLSLPHRHQVPRLSPMKNKKPADDQLKVFITSKDSKCDECGEELGRHAWIVLKENKGALCLVCADLDHLVFLPSVHLRSGAGLY